jgi:hypothetical protein
MESIYSSSTHPNHEDPCRLFEEVRIQYSWILTSGTLGRALVTAEDPTINNAKEASWMSVRPLNILIWWEVPLWYIELG